MTSPALRARLDLLLTAAMAGLVAWLGWRMYSDTDVGPPAVAAIEVPSESITLDGSYLRGDPAAPVAVILYVDYQCPACRGFEQDTLPVLQRDYIDTGRVVLAVRPFPLGYRGDAAVDEAAVVQCAGRQGKFWEAHEAMIASGGSGWLAKLAALSAATGLGSDSLEMCVADERSVVRRVVEEARRIGVRGTPAFFIGRRNAHGDLSVQVARHGASRGSQWFVDLLGPVVETTGR